jgi:hypothetical protein
MKKALRQQRRAFQPKHLKNYSFTLIQTAVKPNNSQVKPIFLLLIARHLFLGD